MRDPNERPPRLVVLIDEIALDKLRERCIARTVTLYEHLAVGDHYSLLAVTLHTDTAQIEAVDELLQTAMERDKMAILAASILEPGRKVWLYVSRTYDPFFDRLEEVLAELPLLPLQFEVVQDSDWSYYQELLDKLQP